METRTFEREGHVRLALATSDLVLEGRSFEGFPPSCWTMMDGPLSLHRPSCGTPS